MLHIIRGLPGAGKTTLAKTLGTHFEADQFFETPSGQYLWKASQVPEAHVQCQARVDAVMRRGDSPVVVSNTFISKGHMAPYLSKAQAYGYTVEIHDLFDSGLTDAQLAMRNVHRVPVDKIARMRRQYER